ncbi:MAG: hypothetical protein F4X44_05340 [Gammaproteobacteria bacterium]|nr:hypothetical protein [Gammaproteobacteria bacterium]MYD80014.1 hypothetical protein [Gammaproteobacteria bacterium]
MNRIPVLGWIGSIVLNLSLSIPFWFIWSVCGVGRHFFTNLLPEPFLRPSLWVILGLFICIEIIRSLLFPMTLNLRKENEKDD